LISGIRYIQELDSRLIEVKIVIFIYIACIVGSFVLASLVRWIWFRNYFVRLREPWSYFLEEINKEEADYVTVITSDGSEIEGQVMMFANKNIESREIIIENPVQIIRDEITKKPIIRIKIGEETLLTKDDIRRISYHKKIRKDPTKLEKLLRVKR
jgi:hypothetical protein